MSYSTQTDMEKRISQAELIRLTDEDDAGSIDVSKITAAIEAADAEIDSYLGSKYALPLGDVPAVIKSWSTDIAIYNLYGLDEGGSIPDTRQKRYDNAISALEDVEAGEQSLGLTAASSGSGDTIVIDSKDRIFTRDKLGGW